MTQIERSLKLTAPYLYASHTFDDFFFLIKTVYV